MFKPLIISVPEKGTDKAYWFVEYAEKGRLAKKSFGYDFEAARAFLRQVKAQVAA